MANQGRGLFVTIFKNFWNSLQPRQITGNKIGTDYLGNTYYEIPAKARRGNSRRERWFTPKNEDDFDQELPAEWDSWLRGRRLHPPTDEEIAKNLKIIETKRENYAKIEREYDEIRPKSYTQPKKLTGYESFPKYDDYEKSPGEFRDKRK